MGGKCIPAMPASCSKRDSWAAASTAGSTAYYPGSLAAFGGPAGGGKVWSTHFRARLLRQGCHALHCLQQESCLRVHAECVCTWTHGWDHGWPPSRTLRGCQQLSHVFKFCKQLLYLQLMSSLISSSAYQLFISVLLAKYCIISPHLEEIFQRWHFLLELFKCSTGLELRVIFYIWMLNKIASLLKIT